MTVYSVLKSIVISTYFLGSCPSQYLWLWYFLGCHLKKYWWLCWNGLCGCVGMAYVAVLEWPMWLCWNGLCSCVGTGLCPLFWAVFSHSCLYNPLFWPILWASHAQWDPLANQNIPLFCVIYFWDAVLKNKGGGTRGNLEWPPHSEPVGIWNDPPIPKSILLGVTKKHKQSQNWWAYKRNSQGWWDFLTPLFSDTSFQHLSFKNHLVPRWFFSNPPTRVLPLPF